MHNMPERRQKQLSHRDSDVVVIMLGTNETEWLAPLALDLVSRG
jgi:hypothetical protein